MTPDKMTLPLSPHDFWLGAGIIAFILLSLLVFLVLNQMAKAERPQLWDDLPANWRLPIVLLGMLWLALFGLTVWAAFAGVLQTISPKDATSQPSLGFGTLLVALLGAPFLIWATVIKQTTLNFQKEGHITDRISKAVEQLGAEKTVERIGRPVTVWIGAPRMLDYATKDARAFASQPRTRLSNEKLQEDRNEKTGEPENYFFQTVSVWPDERTVIQWQDETIAVSKEEVIGVEGTWQVFKKTAPNIEVRIGAILSLERIAQDSTRYDNGRDHVRVMEILCAYVRENGRADSLEPAKPNTPFKIPRLDLQVAMTAIKRRTPEQLALEAKARYRLDLRGVDFGGMDLSGGDLSAALLHECRFGGTSFEDTNLSGARFDRSLLNFVLWWRSTLTGVSFNFCILNRPEPVAGGMVEASPAMGNARGVSVIGADLTAMDYFGEKPNAFFGSKDTKLHYRLDDERKEANSISKELRSAKYRKDVAKVAELEASLTNNPFKNWAPYESPDMAMGHLLSEWRQELGLTAWPHVG